MLPAVGLQGDSHHYHPIDDERPWTHLRLNIYPDGGIARLRLYGVPYRDWSSQPPGTALDLAAAVNGGRALACLTSISDAWATCSTPDVPSTWATAGKPAAAARRATTG